MPRTSDHSILSGLLISAASITIVLGSLTAALNEGPLVLDGETPAAPALEMAVLPSDTPRALMDTEVPPSPTLEMASLTPPPPLPTLTMPVAQPKTPATPVRICPPPGGWNVTTTQSGDTLASLAGKYRTTPDALAKANCLTGDAHLSSGTVLYVPGPSAPATESCKPPSGWVKYVIQSGDTLAMLGYRSNTSAQKIQEANCLGSSTLIHIGQTLFIPASTVAATSNPWLTPTFAFYYPSATIYPYNTAFPTLIYITPQTPASPYAQASPSTSETPMLQAPMSSMTPPLVTTPWPSDHPAEANTPWPSATAR